MPSGIILPSPLPSSLAAAHTRLAVMGAVAQRFPGDLRGAAWRPLGGPRFHVAASGRWGWVRQRVLVEDEAQPHLGTWLGSYELEAGEWTLIEATCAVDPAPRTGAA